MLTGRDPLAFNPAVLIVEPMKTNASKIPDPKEIEKEISEFLSKKFGGNVKMVTQAIIPQAAAAPAEPKTSGPPSAEIEFDLKPADLISYLDTYIVKQDYAKAVLATKICTHFNRIQRARHKKADDKAEIVGRIKNNVLLLGPTGVGKTYMIKLIADKIGVPFVKGDATKFSETGYVGGDVEDLVRDLVREADDDLERAQYGIIYIDEVDKIAGSPNRIGVDVSRTGVQRALLKPMEETEVDLKVPHDPVTMFQELERYRKTGDRQKRSINTKNILFIMSGAFAPLGEIVRKRVIAQGIGFGAALKSDAEDDDLLQQVTSEDLIKFGFESEFVGRLPVRAVFQRLTRQDLSEILQNPNNPVILGKKLDFDAYGIDLKFSVEALDELAAWAHHEQTGARGLVSAVEKALLPFETRLPSAEIKKFPVTLDVVKQPEEAWQQLCDPTHHDTVMEKFNALVTAEQQAITTYLTQRSDAYFQRHGLTATSTRREVAARLYSSNIMDLDKIMIRLKKAYTRIKRAEQDFYKAHAINILLKEDAVDWILLRHARAGGPSLDALLHQLLKDLDHGLKLIREKTGRSRFSLSSHALADPEAFIGQLIKQDLGSITPQMELPEASPSPPASVTPELPRESTRENDPQSPSDP